MRRWCWIAGAVLAALPITMGAQSAAEHVARGDSAHRAMDAPGALRHYEAAIAQDSSLFEALWRAAREATALGEFEADQSVRTELYRRAEMYARRAVEAEPTDPDGHFILAVALGRTALSLGVRERVRYATDIRDAAQRSLRIDPAHAGALHVMGMWNAEVMRLSGVARAFARRFLGAEVFAEASWQNAIRYMERAVAIEPERISHRLDLAGMYVDTGQKAKARAAYEAVIAARPLEYSDRFYQRQAERALRALR